MKSSVQKVVKVVGYPTIVEHAAAEVNYIEYIGLVGHLGLVFSVNVA